jgi:hypothetical protein
MIKKSFTLGAIALLAASMQSCRKRNTQINDPTIKTFSGRMECVWDENVKPNPKAFLDVDNGIVYDVSTAPAHAKDIDLIWTQCSGGSLVCSPNEYYDAFAPSGASSFLTANLLAGWAQRNQSIIDVNPATTVAQFNAIATSSQLLNTMGTYYNSSSSEFAFMECTNIDFNQIYYVETTTAGVKKRAYIRFTAGQKGNNNFVDFTIKAQD